MRHRSHATVPDRWKPAPHQHRDEREQGQDAGAAIKEAPGQALNAVEERVEGSPMAAGLVAFGIGFLAGSLMPGTRRESELASRLEPQIAEATRTVLPGTDPGTVMGTVGYMAPEQVRGLTVDQRADVFAFGAVLYEMTSGTRAFEGATPADTLTAILTADPPELSGTRPDLTPAQREAYDRAEREGVVPLNALGETITVQHVFELVMRLKQICNFDPLTGESAKLERLLADMEEVAASGRKALVFSQWVEPLQVLAAALAPYNPLQYHGKVPQSERTPTLDRFRSDPDRHVLLMTYGCGSVGLNLQFTNYVFLFDRWWNPAIEDQAINRAHRLGQKETVFVKRFICQNTIEGRMRLSSAAINAIQPNTARAR